MVKAADLTDSDRSRIAAAVAKAEAATSIELRFVLAHASSHYGAFALIYPAILALVAGGVALLVLPELTAEQIFVGEGAVFAASVAILEWGALRRRLAPPSAKRKAAWRQARLYYASIGLKQPHLKNTLLLFCSVAERSVEILVDDEIAEKLPETVWMPVVAAFKTDFARGSVADAFVNAASASGALLAPVFPAIPGQANEIPDNVVEI